jgi:hypothetical protein
MLGTPLERWERNQRPLFTAYSFQLSADSSPDSANRADVSTFPGSNDLADLPYPILPSHNAVKVGSKEIVMC